MGHRTKMREFLYLIGTQAFSTYSICNNPIMSSIQDGTAKDYPYLSLSLSQTCLHLLTACPYSGGEFPIPYQRQGGNYTLSLKFN